MLSLYTGCSRRYTQSFVYCSCCNWISVVLGAAHTLWVSCTFNVVAVYLLFWGLHTIFRVLFIVLLVIGFVGRYTQSFVFCVCCSYTTSCSGRCTQSFVYSLFCCCIYLLFRQKYFVDCWCCWCIPAVLCASQIISVLFMLLLYIFCSWRCTHSFMYCLCCCCISIVLGAEHNFLCTLYVVAVYRLSWALPKILRVLFMLLLYICCSGRYTNLSYTIYVVAVNQLI